MRFFIFLLCIIYLYRSSPKIQISRVQFQIWMLENKVKLTKTSKSGKRMLLVEHIKGEKF